MMKFRPLLGMLLALASTAVGAQTAHEVRRQIENTMLVTGTVDIEPDGSTSGHVIDRRDDLPDYVLDLLGQVVPNWRFEPVEVDGVAVPARAKMTVRLLAKRNEEGAYGISVASASFGESGASSTDRVSRLRMNPPMYPQQAVEARVQGIAYVLLKIGRDGSVEDAIVEQVNLRVVGTEREMNRFREAFARSALAAARRWRFVPPTTGPDVDEAFWVARVPVSYSFERAPTGSEYATWSAYVPGPRQRAPWSETDEGNDAIASGDLQLARSRFKLLTPLQQG